MIVSSLKELVISRNPLEAEPSLKKFRVKIEDLDKANKIAKQEIKGMFFNKYFFKGLPKITKRKSIVYILFFNHYPPFSFLRAKEEMDYMNLKPINISLFLYLNSKYSYLRTGLKNIGFMESKSKNNFYLASFNKEEKVNFSIHGRDADIERGAYFLCERKPTFIAKCLNFIKTSIPNILFYSR